VRGRGCEGVGWKAWVWKAWVRGARRGQGARQQGSTQDTVRVGTRNFGGEGRGRGCEGRTGLGAGKGRARGRAVVGGGSGGPRWWAAIAGALGVRRPGRAPTAQARQQGPGAREEALSRGWGWPGAGVGGWEKSRGDPGEGPSARTRDEASRGYAGSRGGARGRGGQGRGGRPQPPGCSAVLPPSPPPVPTRRPCRRPCRLRRYKGGCTIEEVEDEDEVAAARRAGGGGGASGGGLMSLPEVRRGAGTAAAYCVDTTPTLLCDQRQTQPCIAFTPIPPEVSDHP
jgi:hypothetical protein